MNETPEPQLSSKFTSYAKIANINQSNYSFRTLKMKDSYFFYIGKIGNNKYDEIGMAMSVNNNGEVISTLITGTLIGYGSQLLAEKLSKKLKKQIYVSCNVPNDRVIRPLIEQKLNEVIKMNSKFFNV